jgi:transposase
MLLLMKKDMTLEPIGVPQNERDSMTTNTPTGLRSLSGNLGRCLGEQALVKLVLDAVQTVDSARLKEEASKTPGFRPQMLLTLLTYCYASKIYGSRDIEWAMVHDRTVRYLCARVFPDWQVLRRFRRHNRELLAQCLAYVFNQVWSVGLDESEAADFGQWFEALISEQIRAEALHRLDLAALHDGAESD